MSCKYDHVSHQQLNAGLTVSTWLALIAIVPAQSQQAKIHSAEEDLWDTKLKTNHQRTFKIGIQNNILSCKKRQI